MKKYLIFFAGVVVGVMLTVGVLLIFGKMNNMNTKMYDHPISYEEKTVAKFKVFQVLNGYALATEQYISTKKDRELYGDFAESLADIESLGGKTVRLQGNNFYDDQIVVIENPKQLGTYVYRSEGGDMCTIPIVGE